MKRFSASRRGRSNRGFGLVELLVAVAISGVVLVVVATFFAFQTRISRETQARNELNIRIRAVAEAIAQDLRMAGSRAAVDDRGVVGFVRDPSFCGAGLDARCVAVPADDATSPMEWLVSVVYVSSLFLEGADVDRVEILCDGGAEAPDSPVCRRVDYFLGPQDSDDDLRTLYRRDVERGGDDGPSQPVEAFAFEFAVGVQKVEIQFVCGDDASGGSVVEDPADCFVGELNLIREARIAVTAGSERVAGLVITQDASTAMLNLRAPDRFR